MKLVRAIFLMKHISFAFPIDFDDAPELESTSDPFENRDLRRVSN